MSRLSDTLDLLSERGEAAFAIDAADHIVYWNGACEKLLGHPARDVLGKRCHDVIAGRDLYGNMYCFRNCPVAHQARESEENTVNDFKLIIRDGDGVDRQIVVSLFSIPAVRASLSSIVHVLRESENAPATDLEQELAERSRTAPVPRWPLATADSNQAPELTAREREILRSMAEGLGTAEIARKLSITSVTVRNHTQSILQKLDVHTKLAAVVFAFRHELI